MNFMLKPFLLKNQQDLLVHKISDPKEETCDEIIEDFIEASHDYVEDYACPLVPKEACHGEEVHLHENKGLVSFFSSQISEFMIHLLMILRSLFHRETL
jgi:hypothetical protein